MIVFLLALFTAFGGLSVYVAHRSWRGLCAFFPNLKFWPVLLLFLILSLLMIAGFSRSLLPFSPGVKAFLGHLGTYYMGFFIFLFMFTCLSDLALLLLRLFRSPLVMKKLFTGFLSLAVFAASVGTCLYSTLHAKGIHHVSYDILLENKADLSDLNILLMSDLHLGAQGSEARLERIVREINSKSPDLILISGDFFDSDFASIQEPEKALKALKKIQSTYGIWACLGNHDAGKSAGQMISFLKEANIHLLQDEAVTVADRLVLIGRREGSPIGEVDGEKRQKLSAFFSEENSLPVIVLDHNPAHLPEYDSSVDLILCGHTHKGQIFPANFITDAMFEIDYGYGKLENGPQAVVTSGVGYWGMPMRLGTDCEIVSLCIKGN